ncbi:ATP-binding protein [Patescibacteria group bacterium]|nr:ATP-binding protein [Patescibacteria group bacterium]MBU4082800.1 ATP-binding protein [Patescibacteria group bacterium]MCG2808864.1 ATP-binding protein [Candidatus Portnoybacteria bacterium]
MYIKRNIEKKFKKYFLNAPEIIAVVGPRQSGKTTLVKHLLESRKKKVMLSFDNQEDRQMFENNPDDFAGVYIKKGSVLFIDEFHYAKNGGKILKYIYDAYDHPKIIISGSSGIDLTIKAVKYLVGRVFIINLYPFDFREFLRSKDVSILKLYDKYKKSFNFAEGQDLSIFGKEIYKKFLRYYEEYILFGGYPRVVLEKNKEVKKQILKDIYNTYFLREVKDILGLIDDYKLSNLIKALSLQVGNLIDYEELGQSSGFDFKTLKKYLNFLEKTYICRFMRPFFKNKRIEVVKNPKVYFIDMGMRNLIANDFRAVNERTDGGALLENGLASQFIKQEIDVNFWRDKNKNEIDFVLSLGNGKLVALESKLNLKKLSMKGIKTFQKLYPKSHFYWTTLSIGEKIPDKTNVIPCCFL